MARSKAFEALIKEAERTCRKTGEVLNQVVPFDQKKNASKKQTDRETFEQTHKQTNRQTDSLTNGQSDRQTDTQSDRLTDRPAQGQTGRRGSRQSDRQPNERNLSDMFHWMTEKQAAIFSYLASIENRITSLPNITADTGIPYGTVRGSIAKLVQENCITKPSRYRKGNAQGITYNINESIYEQFKKHPFHRQSERQTFRQTERQTDCRADKQALSLISSSSFLNNKSTTAEIKAMIDNDPELGYWRQKGLSAKQVKEWIKQTDIPLKNMLTYLAYCAFEMETLGMENNKPIMDVFNWFYKIIEKSGQYRKPQGYKTRAELQIESEKNIILEQEKKIQELKNLQRKKWEQQREIEFWEMMNDPEGEGYKKCFEQLNDFVKRKALKGGPAFEAAMRKAFDDMLDQVMDSCDAEDA